MIIARFGYEAFYANSRKGFYTLDGISFEYGKDVETQGTTGKKPISYITALKLINGGFKIHLDARFVNVMEKIEAWRKMSEDNNLYVFSIADKLVSQNKFIVLSAKVSNEKYNGRGMLLSADLDITIQEYAGTSTNIGILKKRLEDYS